MKWYKDVFLLTHVGLIILLCFVQLQLSQLEFSLLIQGLRNPFLDLLCLFGTYIGDGWVILAFCMALFFFQPRLAILVLLTYLISAGLTQTLKHTFFSHLHRPLWHIEESGIENVFPATGAEISYNNSFPSGHSTSAFAVFSMLSLFTSSKGLKWFFLSIAVFAAFTRIYLLQHFLVDTLAGSVIGVTCSYLIFYFMYRKNRLHFIFKKIEK